METATDVAEQVVGNVLEQGEVDTSAEEVNTESQDQEQEELSESESDQVSEETQEEDAEDDEEQADSEEEGSEEKTDETSEDEKAQDQVVDEAVKNLEKVLGKKLTDEEAMVALADSHLNAANKIQSLTEQVQDLVTYRESYEQLMADPNIYNYVNGIRPAVPGGEPDETDEIDPQIRSLKDQIAQLNHKLAQRENTDAQQKWVNEVKTIQAGYTKLAERDAEFKKLHEEYNKTLRLNKYAKPPQKLARLATLVQGAIASGTSVDDAIDDAWGVVNKDKATLKMKRKIAAQQLNKTRKTSIHKKPVAKAPKRGYEDAGSVGELVNRIVEDAYEE